MAVLRILATDAGTAPHRDQTKMYESGIYDPAIFEALNKRKEIADILLSFMSEKAKGEKGINPEEYRKVKQYIQDKTIERMKAENPEQWDEKGNFIPQKVSAWGMIKKTFGGE